MRLYDRLRQEFGRDRVFRYPVAAGTNLGPKSAPEPRLSGFTLLAVIGPTWITSHNLSGQPSLDDPRDPVRAELEAALQNDIPLFCVLVTGAAPPGPAELPVRLRALTRKPGIRLTPERFDDDVRTLIDRLGNAGEPAGGTTQEWPFTADPAATAVIKPMYLADRPVPSGDTEIWPRAGLPAETGRLEPDPPAETGRLLPDPPGATDTPPPTGGGGLTHADLPRVPPSGDSAVADDLDWGSNAGEIPGPGETASPAPIWRPQPLPIPPAEPGPPAQTGAGQDQPSSEVKTPGAPQPRPSVRSLLTTRAARTTLTALFSLASIVIAAAAIVIHSAHHSPAPHHPGSSASSHRGSHHSSHRHRHAARKCSPSSPPANLTPAGAVQTLYRDINRRSFCAAWNLGASSITPGETYKSWVAGFSDLRRDDLTITSVSGSNPATVNVTLEVFNRNAAPVTYTGYYLVENGKITGGHLG